MRMSRLNRYAIKIFHRPFAPFDSIFIGIIMLLVVTYWCSNEHCQLRHRLCPSDYWATELDNGFEGFDNESGVANGALIVPNFVHFLRYGEELSFLNFLDAVNILAAFRHQNPEKIFIHTNFDTFKGKYWKALLKIPGLMNVLQLQYIEPVDSVFGQPLNSMYGKWHSSDILRIRILRQFGGIFIDNDVYLVQKLDRLRKFEMTIELPDDRSFGTQTLVAHKDSRFLKLWLDSYKNYFGHLWYYNAGVKPRLEIYDSRPELVHAVHGLFGIEDLKRELFLMKWPLWREKYTIHTLVRHIYYLHDPNQPKLQYPVTFNEKNILDYNVTILDMVTECCPELMNL